MLKLGLQTELRDKTNKLKCFSYNLKTYNNKRSWNNPKVGLTQKILISLDGSFNLN